MERVALAVLDRMNLHAPSPLDHPEYGRVLGMVPAPTASTKVGFPFPAVLENVAPARLPTPPSLVRLDLARQKDARIDLLSPAANTVRFDGSYLVLPVAGRAGS